MFILADASVQFRATYSANLKNVCRREYTQPRVSWAIDLCKEELVAEIASASILSHLRIETDQSFRNSVAYVQSWIKVLRNDTRMIVSAASKAEKAVAYILDIQTA